MTTIYELYSLLGVGKLQKQFLDLHNNNTTWLVVFNHTILLLIFILFSDFEIYLEKCLKIMHAY